MNVPSSSKHSATRRRWWVWLPLLGLSAWLASQQPEQTGPEIVQPKARAAGTRPTTLPVDSANESLLALLDRRQWPDAPTGKEQAADLFAQRSWTPPPKPAASVKPPPSPPPTAPPLPFSFIGKKSQGGAWEVYLTRGDLSYIVREGMTFADAYRVDNIQPPEMTLIYMPLEQTQVINIGVAQ